MPATLDAEAFLDGRRTAALAPATLYDRARLTPDGDWLELDQIPLGSQVHEVNHFDRHTSTHGGVMSMRSLKTDRRYDLVITSIHLVRSSELTAEEMAELGYSSREAFDQFGWGAQLKDRRAWLMRVMPAGDTVA